MQTIEISSWNRFITRDFVITPELLGKSLGFTFRNHIIRIELPSSDKINRDKGYDEMVSVRVRRSEDNEPLEYEVHKVDVIVTFPMKHQIPSEVLTRNLIAYELFTSEEQEKLNDITWKHEVIAEHAFNYWIGVTRWITDNSNIGQFERVDKLSDWRTYLMESKSEKKFWAGPAIIVVPRITPVTVQEWTRIEMIVKQGVNPPLFVELKHDGEMHLKSGDINRAVVDLARACEIFLRQSVYKMMPNDMSRDLVEYIERAPIHMYHEKFFPSVLTAKSKEDYKKLSSRLKKLFESRNKILHEGKLQSLTELDCQNFVKVTNELLSME